MELRSQELNQDSSDDQTRSLINIHRQRLTILKQQAAQFGSLVPPHIQIEIETVENSISELEQQQRLISVLPDVPVDVVCVFSASEDGTIRLFVRGVNNTGHTGTFSAPWGKDKIERILYMLRSMNRSSSSSLAPDQLHQAGIDARDIGHQLYTALFSDAVKHVYDQACMAANGRIRLIIVSQLDHINALPWELLHNGDDFMCLDRDTPVVRGVLIRPRIAVAEVPLRILMIGATISPEILQRIQQERESIAGYLQESIQRHLVQFESLIGSDAERKLPTVLGRFRPHLLHIAGFGSLADIQIDTIDGRSRQLTTNTLVRLLRNVKSVQMVIINGGDSVIPKDDDLYLAYKLVRTGIPAVVTMQSGVSDLAALAFAEGYYEALSWNWPMQEAVTWGRSRMVYSAPSPELTEWMTPLVYSAIGEMDLHAPLQEVQVQHVSNETVYRGLLELVWENDVVSDSDQKRLDQKRLNLGISPQRAELLEREVRSHLAQAALDSAQEVLFTGALETARENYRRALMLDPENQVALDSLLRWAYWPDNLLPISHATYPHVELFLRIKLPGRIFATAWSPDGAALALATEAGFVLYDTSTLEIKFKLSDADYTCFSVAWSPDSRFLAAGDDVGVVRIWDIEQQRQLPSIYGLQAHIHALAFKPNAFDEPLLAIGDSEGNLSLASIKYLVKGNAIHPTSLDGHNGSVYSLAWKEDGHVIASGSGDQHIHVIQPGVSGHVVLRGHNDWIRRLAWSPNGRFLASSSGDQSIIIWDWPLGKEHTRLVGHGTWVRGLAWSNDGLMMLSGGGDGYLRVWDALLGNELRIVGPGDLGLINDMTLHPNGQLLAVGSFEGELTLWGVPPKIKTKTE